MGYSKEAYEYAIDKIAGNKRTAEQACEQRKAEIYTALPSLKEINAKLNSVGIEAVRAAAMLNGTGRLTELKSEFERLSSEKSKLMKDAGISESDLEPKYACKLCGDTAYVDGKMCECAKKAARVYEYERLSSKMPLEQSTFDKFELRYYSGTALEKMEKVLAKCRNFSDKFSLKANGMLFIGKTGIGKTHLSLAIANEVLKKGYGVVYGTAQELLSRIEREHFGRADGDTLTLITESDLLIIDDLGAEFQTQFTVSAVYNIINARIMEGRPTVISTNLMPNEIAQIYGERVSSRIIGYFTPLKFEGNDVRQLKAMKK